MKNIPFATKYYVSEDGKVYSDITGKLKELKANVDSSRYKRFSRH